VFRPADANETVAGWKLALSRTDGPTALVVSRQDLPVLTPAGAPGAERGAYVLPDDAAPQVILIATGSEVAVALDARARLAGVGIPSRVVSMPCWEIFQKEDPAYRESVLPSSITARVSVEAGATLGWREWIGARGVAVGIDRFGASAPGEVVLEQLGISGEAVFRAAQEALRGEH
jgi:transketolase